MISEFDPIITCCQDLLNNFPPAQKVKEYIDGRLSKEAQEKFQFGWFPTNEHLHILEEAVGEEVLSKTKTNLVYDKFADGQKKRHGVLENHNLILPYKNVYGKIIGIVGRTIQTEDERKVSGLNKYKNTSFDKGENLFGFDLARKNILEKNCAIIVEGQLDLIIAHENGMTNAVALGASNMTIEQIALLLRYCDRMVLLLDADEPGRLGALKIKEQYEKYIDISIKELPAGYKDVGEMGELEGFGELMR
jgi:DNA primase